MNNMEKDITEDEIVGSDFINFINSNDRISVRGNHSIEQGEYQQRFYRTRSLVSNSTENERPTRQSYEEKTSSSTYDWQREPRTSERPAAARDQRDREIPERPERPRHGERQTIFIGEPHLGQSLSSITTPTPTFEKQNTSPVSDHQNEGTPLQLGNRQASPPAFFRPIASQSKCPILYTESADDKPEYERCAPRKRTGQDTKVPRYKQTTYNEINAGEVNQTLLRLNSGDKSSSLRGAKKREKTHSANAKHEATCLLDTSAKESVVAHRSRPPSFQQKSFARQPSSISRSDYRSTPGPSQPASRCTSTSYQFVSPAPDDAFSRSSSRTPSRGVSPTHYCPKCDHFYNKIVTCQHSILGRKEMGRSLNFTKSRISESQDRMGVTIHTVGNNATINYGIARDLTESISHQTLQTGSKVRRPEPQSDEQLTSSRCEYSRHSASLPYVRKRQPETITPSLSRSINRAVQRHHNANIKMDHESYTCDVTDICQLPDGTFAITDTNNMSVKILSDEYKPLSNCRMQALPQYICHVKDQELAVTLSNWTIHFLYTGGSGAIREPFFTDHLCMGISHYGKNLYVTDGGNTVYVHNLYGEPVRTLNNDFFMKQIFSRIRKISVAIEDGTIYVADLDNGLVMIPKKQENNPKSVPSKNVQSALGLSLDTANRIYVSGEDSHNVAVIEMYSNIVLCNINLLHYGIDAHKAICVDNKNHRLLISTHMCNNLIAIDLD